MQLQRISLNYNIDSLVICPSIIRALSCLEEHAVITIKTLSVCKALCLSIKKTFMYPG